MKILKTTDMTEFHRYRKLIDNWEPFRAAVYRALPKIVWTNTLRITTKELKALLDEEKIIYDPLPSWHPEGVQLCWDFKPSEHWAYHAGLYHVQEAVSMLPVTFFKLRPGDRVLDLCAAPGNKSAQVSVRLNNQGTVIANDINSRRMRAARHTWERLGLTNITSMTHDGANLPKASGPYDKILVDVPCSCEGTTRKHPEIFKRLKPKIIAQKSGLQKALLRKAVQLCKPGGSIVYSTCTYAPEENEMVVGDILNEFGPDVIRLELTRPKYFNISPGLTEWKKDIYGSKADTPWFHPVLSNAMRMWPHQNDTGGFFIALLKKQGKPTGDEPDLWHPPIKPPASEKVDMALATVKERFGIEADAYDGYTFYEGQKSRVYVVGAEHYRPPEIDLEPSGMLFMRMASRYPKPTTAAALAFGAKATRNIIDLNKDQIFPYLHRETYPVSVEQVRWCTGKGYVLVRYKGYTLGTGLYFPNNDGSGRLESLYPKGWSPKNYFEE